MHHDDDDVMIDRLLRVVPVRVDPGFTDAVMRRVAQTPRATSIGSAAVLPWPAQADPVLPWWTRALLEPVTLLAFLAAAILAGWPTQLLEGASGLASRAAAQLTLASLQGSDGWIAITALTLIGSLAVVALAVRGTQWFFNAGAPRSGARASR